MHKKHSKPDYEFVIFVLLVALLDFGGKAFVTRARGVCLLAALQAGVPPA
jgi:hypothetical protein